MNTRCEVASIVRAFRQDLAVAGLALGVALSVFPAASSASDASAQLVTASHPDISTVYARAERWLPWNLQGKVKNLAVRAHWLAGEDRFWYRRDSAVGHEFVLIDATKATRVPAFDHTAVADGMSRLSGNAVGPDALPFDVFSYDGGPHRIVFTFGRDQIRCDTNTRTCEKIVEPAGQTASASGGLPSPDGARSVFVRDSNLWIRETTTGSERPLTTDGIEHYGYGVVPEMAVGTIRLRRGGIALPPYSTVWSPDGRKVVVARVDERDLDQHYFLESAPVSGSVQPVLHRKRYSKPGDSVHLKANYVVIDVGSGAQTPIRLDDGPSQNVFLTPETTAWSRDSRLLYTMGRSAYGQDGYLFRIDTVTGAVGAVIEEKFSTSFRFNSVVDGAGPNVRILPESGEAIWFSEKDGWGHLYLYDLESGRLKNRITRGPWLVRDIIQVDAQNREIYFTGGGREPGRNPYYRHLYRVSFDGSGLKLLTPEDADHEFSGWDGVGFGLWPAASPPPRALFSSSSKYFIDTYSTVSTPPVTVLRRSTDGRVVLSLERADPAALLSIGWIPPQPFTVKAADGKTDLYGLLYLPSAFDKSKTYPVLDHIYQGPNLAAVPWNFGGFEGYFNSEMQARAELGFIIVQLDGRGTANRSREFRDAVYGKLDELRIDDHVAVIKALSHQMPQMDLERVGIYGHSFGGYAASRAMLLYPDFFKVGISSAGVHHLLAGAGNWVTQFQGPPLMPSQDGQTGDVGLMPENYRSADNRTLATQLRGHLMLAYSDMDENTGSASVLQFASALVDANKDFDLLYLPNRSHGFASEPYFIRRSWDYFVRNLMGVEPPEDFAFQTVPPAPH